MSRCWTLFQAGHSRPSSVHRLVPTAESGPRVSLSSLELSPASAAHTWRLGRGDRPVLSKRVADCPILCAALCPHPLLKHHAALGLASGSVAVVDVLTGHTVYRLPGHTTEVQALAWCPYSGDLRPPPAQSEHATSQGRGFTSARSP
jgi:hypothetical protein